jgi:uncharacterized protein YjiS (DUF1127 family)
MKASDLTEVIAETCNTDTDNYHLTRRFDGWFVVGRNTLGPVSSYDEGRRFIRELEEMSKLRELSLLNDGSD